MNAPILLNTSHFDQPWTLENYLKVGGYQALRKSHRKQDVAR